MSDQQAANDAVDKLLDRPKPVSNLKRRRVILFAIPFVVGALLIAGIALYREFAPLDAAVPDNLGAQYMGLERGSTAQGLPRLGRADAPVIIEDFSSFACPHCRDFHHELFPELLDDIAAGEVQFVFFPVTHIGPGAGSAARAALCAGEQGQFWEMSDVLFDWQKRYITLTFEERRIRKGAEHMGLNMDQFNACLDDDRPAPTLDYARSEFHRRGLRGTPSFFLNGERVTNYSEITNLGGDS